MKYGVWISSLVFSLSGWTIPLLAQGPVWRPVNVPQPAVPTTPVASQPGQAAMPGQPAALPYGFGTGAPSVLQPTSYLDPTTPARSSASNGPVWTDDANNDNKNSDFATAPGWQPVVPTPTAKVVSTPTANGSLQQVALGDASANLPTNPPANLANPPANLMPSIDPGYQGVPQGPVPVTADDVHQPRFYLSGEYLLWWFKQDKVPVLASTSSNPFDNGELGKPTTEVLFGGDGIGGGAQSGFRFYGGYWLDDSCKDIAIEFGGFYFSPQATNFVADSSQYPVIARPFFNVNQQIEFAQLTAFPGVATGRLSIENDTNFFGAEVNARCNICCGCGYRLDLLGGFRFLELQETLGMTENVLGLPAAGPPFANNTFVVSDYFSTRNDFYGGQVGLAGEFYRGPWSLEVRGMLAVGDTVQDILIDGSQTLTTPSGSTQHFVGGLLAERSNIGNYTRDRFSVVPELDFNVGYQITNHIRAFVGYDVLYWSNVARPGGQIDRNIDITQIPNFPVPGVKPVGQTEPSAPRNSTDFWAQGLTFGFEIRY